MESATDHDRIVGIRHLVAVLWRHAISPLRCTVGRRKVKEMKGMAWGWGKHGYASQHSHSANVRIPWGDQMNFARPIISNVQTEVTLSWDD